MSLVCLAAVRLRIIPLRIAVAVAVLGGIGPFFGSAEFIREQRAARASGMQRRLARGRCPAAGSCRHARVLYRWLPG